MFSSNLPNLKKLLNNSSSHYKDFHNIFYLSQITNLTLISYIRQEQVATTTINSEKFKKHSITKHQKSRHP